MFDAIDISAGSLVVEGLRTDITAERLANAQTTHSPGGPDRHLNV
jgi:flagellar basal body rod protein FlgC